MQRSCSSQKREGNHFTGVAISGVAVGHIQAEIALHMQTRVLVDSLNFGQLRMISYCCGV